MAVASNGQGYSTPALATASNPQLQLNLQPYPFFANLQSVMTEDRGLLDRLLKSYARKTPAAMQDHIDFLSRYVPVYVFERTLQPSEAGDPDLSTRLWLMRLAGYFGGVWLRTEFVTAGVPRGAFPVSEASFASVVTRISAAIAAFNGDDVGSLAYAEASLLGNADWARAAVRSNAMTVPLTGSYGVGLFDGTGQLPTITTL